MRRYESLAADQWSAQSASITASKTQTSCRVALTIKHAVRSHSPLSVRGRFEPHLVWSGSRPLPTTCIVHTMARTPHEQPRRHPSRAAGVASHEHRAAAPCCLSRLGVQRCISSFTTGPPDVDALVHFSQGQHSHWWYTVLPSPMMNVDPPSLTQQLSPHVQVRSGTKGTPMQ